MGVGNLQSAVDELFAVDVRELSDEALKDDIVCLGATINRLNAAYLGRLEVLDRRGAVAAEHGSTGAWLRGQLNMSPPAAGRDVHLARDLADLLPHTAAALAAGEISPAHARVIASLRHDLDPDAVRAADPHLAEAARTHTPHELLGFVTHVRHAYRPDKVARDERTAFDERELHASSTLGGLGVGGWSGDLVSQELIMTAIHAASAPQPGDTRTARQRRYDGLVAICERSLRGGELPETGGVAPHVSVIVNHDSLSGVAGSPAATLGYGAAVSAQAARMFACDGSISRIVIGPAGEILDSGRATRCFTAAQRRAIVARDRHCRWPGCDRPSGWCDAHHRVHWVDGGATSVDNGVLLCGRHHRQLHRDNHRIDIGPDGSRTVDPTRGSGGPAPPSSPPEPPPDP